MMRSFGQISRTQSMRRKLPTLQPRHLRPLLGHRIDRLRIERPPPYPPEDAALVDLRCRQRSIQHLDRSFY